MSGYLKEFWRGYKAMKRMAYDYGDHKRAFREIYDSNAGEAFVRGAGYAYEYINRVGVANIKVD